MNEKVKKTLYLPDWVADLLDREGQKYDGPGVVAASAITSFCLMSDPDKVKTIQDYRSKEVERAYLDTQSIVESAAQDEKAGKKRTRQKRSSKESA